MPKKGSTNKGRYKVLVDSGTYDDFSVLCEELGLVRSKHVENYMKQFIDEHKELLDKLKRGGQK